MWSWQALVQPHTCMVSMRHSSEYQSLLCYFYILWSPSPFSATHTAWASQSFQRASLLHWIFPFSTYNKNKWKPHPLQYSALHKHSDVIWPFPHGWSSEVGPHHAPCTARFKSFQHVSWSLKEQTLYGTCFCTFGIYLEIFELVLIKDVQNSLEIFGVWNQYIARNPVQINKWNGNKPYLGTERNHHPPSVCPA